MGGLGEDRRRIADSAQIDATDSHRLQQRWPELEFDPLDVPAQRGKPLFQVLVLFAAIWVGSPFWQPMRSVFASAARVRIAGSVSAAASR